MQEEHHGWKFRAVMSLEIGGNNSLLWDQHAEPADVGALRRDGWPGNAGRLAS
jgi:hypothetical protein